MLTHSDLVVYTDSRLFSLQGRLYRPPRYFFIGHYLMGMTIIDIMLYGHRLTIRRDVYNSTLVYRITCGVCVYFLEIAAWDHEMLLITPSVSTLQRALRAWLERKAVERRLAVAMAAHPRLGAGSGLEVLGADLIDLCARFVTWTPGKRERICYSGRIQERRLIAKGHRGMFLGRP